MSSVKKAFSVFNRKQKWKLVWMVVIILIGSLAELLGVTAILPFINVALNPDSIFENGIMLTVYEMLGLHSTNEFLILLGVLLIIIYVVKNLYVIYMNNHMYKFSYRCQKELASRLLISYMKQPYSFFSSHNSADFVRNLNHDTILFFETVIASLQLFAEVLVCGLLGMTLLVLEPTLIVGVGVLLGLFVLTVYRYLKQCLEQKGRECRGHRAQLNKWVLEATGGIKETKILGKEQFFIEQYEGVYELFAEDYRRYKMYSFLPKPLMEALCVCAMLLVVVIKIISGTDMSQFLPVLSVFAVAIFRMLPSFNRITSYVSLIMFNRSSVDAICNDLSEVENENDISFDDNDAGEVRFEDKIELNAISFRYPGAEENVVTDISLVIPKGKSVAFIGASGAGKTTLADIVLGVLSAQEGEILVDGAPINALSRAWHKKVGYIPQSIFLMDDSIRNNIAFGEEVTKIKEEQVQAALEGAQLKEFIDSLPEGLDTVIGEGGVRLSGGQRQRIGIARALYFNPEILVLDEATSALDNDTEKAVMDAIDKLAGTKTLLIIAHRLSTIKNCNIVYEIKDGRVGVKKDE